MTTYYERHRDEIIDLNWKQAFMKLASEVLDNHLYDAWDFVHVYLPSQGYIIIGEQIRAKNYIEIEDK